MRRSLITAFSALALAAMATLAFACGFEDPSGASARRVMLNQVYPNSLYALGAVDTALRAGVIRIEHLATPTDPLAFQRTAGNLRRFARRLSDGAPSVPPAFSLVLLGPVLWTRFAPGADGIVADIHAAEPLAGRVVVATDVPVIAALVSGDISGAEADAAELVRFYGDPAEIKVLREALALAFRADAEQKGRAQDLRALPTFR
jgi:hypothetical protein